MMRFSLLVAGVFLVFFVTAAQADIVERTYFFTGADVVNNVFDATARHSDKSLKVHEGMRQIGPAVGTAVGATFLSGDYLTQFNNAWNDAVDNGYVLDTFYLFGMASYAGQWGEDYKPFEWVAATAPDGWNFVKIQSASPPSGSHTNLSQGWYSTTGGLVLDDPNLDSLIFSVTIKFDTDDMWWGNPDNYLYGCNTAPNSLDGLTAYFTSYLSSVGGSLTAIPPTDAVYRYVGNMYMAVPEPGSLMVLAMGVGSVIGALRLRRK